MTIEIAPSEMKIVAKPIITISLATSSSTSEIAEKKIRMRTLANLEIKEAPGISSRYNDFKTDF